ncbi:hypothetical protein JQ612_18795 [Bradyrhizobium manausense]|uniref:hypothetical protein n=1 Tax=Bradyrhizobium manausense TaxID=989370 RepID=UPI001BAD347A|nr:hypothetical protein [Bradyrhizobium manausense]MBR0835238.1 hypothetical protein [Bradyrhizobium manausense]
MAGTLGDPISLVAAEIHHGLGAASAHAGRPGFCLFKECANAAKTAKSPEISGLDLGAAHEVD